MLNAARAVSISLFRHTREVWPLGNVALSSLFYSAGVSFVPTAESTTRAAFLILGGRGGVVPISIIFKKKKRWEE